MACGDGPLLSLEEVILENQPTLLASSSLLQDGLAWDSSKHVPEQATFALLMSRFVNLLLALFQDPELHHRMVKVARAAPDLHTPNQFFV